MPYTLAHPAAILPLRKLRFFTYSGLVVGSLSPDFEHVIRLEVRSLYSHSPAGWLWFCLPMGVAVLALYRTLWRPYLSTIFPQLRNPPARILFWQDGLSILVGAATHIAWDSFTHRGRFGPRHIEWLNREIQIDRGLSLPAWNLLQHLSTVAGLICVTLIVFADARKAEAGWWQRMRLRLVGTVALLAPAAMAFSLVLGASTIQSFVVLMGNNLIVVTAVALTAAGVRYRMHKS